MLFLQMDAELLIFETQRSEYHKHNTRMTEVPALM